MSAVQAAKALEAVEQGERRAANNLRDLRACSAGSNEQANAQATR